MAALRELTDDLRDGFVDLVLGSSCVGCQHPGRALCARCRDRLPAGAGPWSPTPRPVGLLATHAAGPYADPLRALVVAHKERRVLALARPLGDVLAVAVASALGHQVGHPLRDAVVLVPVPSRASSVRARGHDPTAAVTRRAARVLQEAFAVTVVVAPLLRLRPGVADQSGLDTRARAANLGGAMALHPAAVRRLARRVGTARVIVCDDVVTTGATLREAQRALESVGIRPLAAACVAATQRRVPGRSVTTGLT